VRKKQDMKKGIHEGRTHRTTEARKKGRTVEGRTVGQMIKEKGRQNGRTADNERSEQNVQEPNRVAQFLTGPKTQREKQQRANMHTATAHERKQTGGTMGKGGRKEGRERTGEETKDKEGSNVRGRGDGRDGRDECERGTEEGGREDGTK
jgi:hypothetical protein